MNHAMYSTDPPHLFANRCHHPSVRGLLSERYIRRINSKSAREWLQLTIRLSAPDMPDGAAKHGKTECHESVVEPVQTIRSSAFPLKRF